MPNEKDPLFEVREISKDYQNLHVLEKISFEVYPHEVVAIIGPSGCGKSTLLRIISGLMLPSEGKILCHGRELQGLMPNMCMVFQTFALYPWMTVKENIEIVLKAARVSTEEMERQTKEAIELIGLVGFEDSYPREISGGMKQRVGIARALVRKPEMLFMDEPFSEVDAFTAEVLRAELIKIWSNEKLGLKSILFVSHDVQEVAYMADRIVVLAKNPATVQKVIENKMSRPRDYRSPEFLKLVEELHDTYGRIETPMAKPRPKKEKAGPLIYASPDEILGLLGYLEMRGGAQDIFKIGAEIHQHFDKVTVVLEAAAILDFIETIHRNVSITTKGKEFFTGSDETRHKLWKEEIMTLPIVLKVANLLKKDPNRSMGREALLDFLKRELPHQDAATQLHILIHWGQYGRLFTYNKVGKYLSLSKAKDT